MPVLSNRNTIYNVGNKRFSTLAQAETYMRSQGIIYGRLEAAGIDPITDGITKYNYDVPAESYIHVEDKLFLICGNTVTLTGTATGVSQSQLSFEWEQTTGIPGILVNPTEETTLFIRNNNDTSDKKFIFKVLNSQTQVFNQVEETLFGTPTEKTYLSGGIPNTYKLDQLNWINSIVSKVDRPVLGNTDTYIDDQFGYLFIDNFDKALVRVEVYISTGASYTKVSTTTFPRRFNGYIPTNFIAIPDSYFGSTFYSKVRFVYNFNNSGEQYVETSVDTYNPQQVAILNEKVNLVGYNISQVVNFGTDIQRSELLEQDEVDNATVSIFYSSYSDYSTTLLRQTLTTIGQMEPFLLDPANVQLYYSTYSNYSTTIQRLSGSQIGGG